MRSFGHFRRISLAISGEWRERYFVLESGKLRYWQSEADFLANKPPQNDAPIMLDGHEVLVDTNDMQWVRSLARPMRPLVRAGAPDLGP